MLRWRRRGITRLINLSKWCQSPVSPLPTPRCADAADAADVPGLTGVPGVASVPGVIGILLIVVISVSLRLLSFFPPSIHFHFIIFAFFFIFFPFISRFLLSSLSLFFSPSLYPYFLHLVVFRLTIPSPISLSTHCVSVYPRFFLSFHHSFFHLSLTCLLQNLYPI